MTGATRWYLAMADSAAFRPPRRDPDALDIRRLPADPAESRALYVLVGTPWHWVDRLGWSEARWRALLEAPGHETWVLRHEGRPAGFYELRRESGGTTEILLFGLAPPFIGQGLGGALLAHAVRRGWEEGTARLVLNTCSRDHPDALAAYLARGFVVERVEQYEVGE